MNISLGISPCPNDTFIFYALVHQKIDTKGLTFSYTLADVEQLNLLAMKNSFQLTKLSYHALSQCTQNYDLLSAGGALGRNCGPLLISKESIEKEALSQQRIALPGRWTTANFLLQFYAPHAKNTSFHLFSDIEEQIRTQAVEAGVIIHENRFTYAERGFTLLQDLGQYWEEQTGFPIPLGGIVVQNHLDADLKATINSLLQESIAYAWNQEELPSFVVQNAQEMSQEIMRQHISLYVNNFSVDLGEEGKQAVRLMMKHLAVQQPLNIIETWK